MSNQSVYHTLNVLNEGRLVLSLDHTDKGEAIRESIEFQEDGFETEILTLSTANIFDCVKEEHIEELERIAY
jgi:hypothetical protein